MSAPQKKVRRPATKRSSRPKESPAQAGPKATHIAYPTAFVEELISALKGIRIAFNAQGLDGPIQFLTNQGLAVTVQPQAPAPPAPPESSPIA